MRKFLDYRLLAVLGAFLFFCLFYSCREASAGTLPQAPCLPQAPEMPAVKYTWKKWKGGKEYLSLCADGKEVGVYDVAKATYHPVLREGVYAREGECPVSAPSENCECLTCDCTPENHCGCQGKIKVAG
jgi:hypothetical protein